MNERTTEITNRFTNSWNETITFYNNLFTNYPGFERLHPIKPFLETLRKNGDDKFFRLGTSIHRLIISRSVEHGLRPDQKFIVIDAYDNKFEVTFRDGYTVYKQYKVDTLDDTRVTKLLQTLKGTLID